MQSNQNLSARLTRPLKGAAVDPARCQAGRIPASHPWSGKPRQWRLGYDQGRQEATAEASTGLQNGMAALQQATAQLRGQFENEIKALEPQAVTLALAIASNVLQKEVAGGNYDIQGIVSQVLQSVKQGGDTVIVRLHPEDHKAILEAGQVTPGVEFEPDPAVARASCAVKTTYGTIVRDTNSLLEEIRQAMGLDSKEASPDG